MYTPFAIGLIAFLATVLWVRMEHPKTSLGNLGCGGLVVGLVAGSILGTLLAAIGGSFLIYPKQVLVETHVLAPIPGSQYFAEMQGPESWPRYVFKVSNETRSHVVSASDVAEPIFTHDAAWVDVRGFIQDCRGEGEWWRGFFFCDPASGIYDLKYTLNVPTGGLFIAPSVNLP